MCESGMTKYRNECVRIDEVSFLRERDAFIGGCSFILCVVFLLGSIVSFVFYKKCKKRWIFKLAIICFILMIIAVIVLKNFYL